MSLTRTLLDLVATPLKLQPRPQPPPDSGKPRILVIRRNRMGDMIYTLPLLHALRRHNPKAHITVACDPLGEPIALACAAVNDVVLLQYGWNPWQAAYKNARYLQGYDWVIAVKGGFDRRLAVMTRLTNASVRIGFERHTDRPSAYFTDPVPLPDKPNEEHQVETLLRLLKPLGLVKTTSHTVDLSLRLPSASLEFASHVLSAPPFATASRFLLINLSSTVRVKFREEDFIAVARRLLATTQFAIGFVSSPFDRQKAHEIAMCMGTKRIIAIDTPSPLDLAALLDQATVLLTPEGGAAHLAAAVGTPALVLWSEGPFEKWHSRGRNHVYVKAELGGGNIPMETVWNALQPFLERKGGGMDKQWDQLLELPTPPSSDLLP